MPLALGKRLLAFGLMACVCAIVSAAGHKLSRDDACNRLKRIVATEQSAPHGQAEYRCEPDAEEGAGRYYVFALRSNFPAPRNAGRGLVGSALVGWYAVSSESGEIYEWDVGEEVVGRRLSPK